MEIETYVPLRQYVFKINNYKICQFFLCMLHAGIDIIPLICTLVACLAYSIEFGILIGIAVNLTFVLYNIARPNIHVYNRKVCVRACVCLDCIFFHLVYQIDIDIHHCFHFLFEIIKFMDQELLVLMPDQSLTFSSADHIKYKLLKYAIQSTSTFVVIDGRYVRTIDATVAKVKYAAFLLYTLIFSMPFNPFQYSI